MATIASAIPSAEADVPTKSSMGRRFLDRLLEGRRRKADLVIARYLRECRPNSAILAEFERRLKQQ
jgi:hypothetical protein